MKAHGWGMSRSLRTQYEGARHHVINRGNYRNGNHATEGVARLFLATVIEAAHRRAWRLRACVLMRNHCQLVIKTPRANLTGGMRWLRDAAAARFNRRCKEHGHVFRGRYKTSAPGGRRRLAPGGRLHTLRQIPLTIHFRLPTSDFRLPSSDLQLLPS